MKRKRFKIFMVSFIVAVTAVLSGFMINNLQDRKKSNSQNSQTSIMTEGAGDSSNEKQTEETGFTFYVNESAATKTKTTTNEITTFVLEVKLFITNKSSKTENIDPDAFSMSYDTEGTGLLFSLEYGDIEKPIILEGKATTSINFVLKYLIQDVEKFNDCHKHHLTINYVGKQILVCSV